MTDCISPTAERVRALLDYDPATGVFTWLVQTRNRVRPGSRAGAINGRGYRQIRIDGRAYQASRLAWLWVNGAWPAATVDHINRRRDDDRIANLREATRREQEGNKGLLATNTSGNRGVFWSAHKERWRVQIYTNGQQRYLGDFRTKEEASAAYDAAAREHFGEFFNGAAERRAP